MEDSCGVIDHRKPYRQQRIKDACDEAVYDELPKHLVVFKLSCLQIYEIIINLQ